MKYKTTLSYCTVCMNRLSHLQQTLPFNLEENNDFDNVQFVVLDYNSKDGLEAWVKADLADYIKSGKLIYYKNNDAEQFHRSHSRNMAFRLANADLLCNVDADNMVLRQYTEFILGCFEQEPDIFVTADTTGTHYFVRDVVGRICCRKEDFFQVQGFDETMSGYGFEDNDLISRLERMGKKRVIIENIDLLSAIKHQDVDRVENESTYKKLHSIYVLSLPNDTTKFIILLKDQTFIYASVTPSIYSSHVLPYYLKKKVKGNWREEQGSIELNYAQHRCLNLQRHQSSLAVTDGRSNFFFRKLTDLNKIHEAMLNFMMLDNQEIYQLNKKQNVIAANLEGFGKGVVFRNFNYIVELILD